MFMLHVFLFRSFRMIQVTVGTLRPTSRGTITLKSADPFESPAIDPCYLSTKEDVRDMRISVRLARQVCRLPRR